jgi:hypothetical protein
MRTIAFLMIAIVCFASSARAQNNKPNQNNKKNDEAEIRAAQAKLEDAKKEATAAAKEAQEAKQHLAKVRSDLIALRRKIEDQADNSSELKKAHERVDQAKAAMEPLVTPILNTLRQSPEYAAATKLRDDLRLQLQNTAAPEDRAVVAKQIVDAEAAIRKLEAAAIEKVPAVAKAKEKLTAAEVDLREAIASADKVLLKDQRYAAAKRDLEKAENQAEAAAGRAVTKQRAVAAAQNKVSAEIAEERKEDARERQQQQQKKKNNNKKKN